MSDKDRVPPRVDEPSPPPPPVDWREQAREAGRVAGRKIVDSLNNAMATTSVTNRIARAVGDHEREHGLSTHMFRTWVDMLNDRQIEIGLIGPDSEGEELDAKLVETTSMLVRWMKQRERQRREAGQ